MADGVAITAGSGTTVATDDIGGVHYQRVKVTWGVDATATDVSASNPLPVQNSHGTATLANVSASASSVTIQASNASRRSLLIFNDSSVVVYVKFGSTASATSYTVQIAAGGYYELPQPVYTGIVTGIWVSATGTARVTEGT